MGMSYCIKLKKIPITIDIITELSIPNVTPIADFSHFNLLL